MLACKQLEPWSSEVVAFMTAREATWDYSHYPFCNQFIQMLSGSGEEIQRTSIFIKEIVLNTKSWKTIGSRDFFPPPLPAHYSMAREVMRKMSLIDCTLQL